MGQFDHAHSLIFKNGNFTPFLPKSLAPSDNPVLPSQAANLGAIMGEDPDHIWSDFASLPVLDSVGSQNFTQSSGSPSLGVEATGLWDGTDHTTRVAVEMTTTLDMIALASGEDLDPGTDSFAMLLVYQVPTASAGNKSVITTRQAGDLQGWSGMVLNGSNQVYGQADQGASHVSAIVTGDTVGVPWRYMLLVVDRTSETLSVHTDLASSSVSIAGHGTYTGAASTLILGFAPTGSTLPDMKVAYAAYWSGTKAENLGATEATAFWQPQIDNPP